MVSGLARHLIIRADAGGQSGTGHLMRSLALAQHWQLHGGAVTFLSHCESPILRQLIESSGFNFTEIPSQHPHSSDLQMTLAMLAEAKSGVTKPDALWLAIDGYHFDSDYQKKIRAAGYKLLVIDDMAHLDAYHANILLNQNITARDLCYHSDPETLMLLGTEYVLLRSEFLKWKGWHREIPEVARKILITLGGSDPDNITVKIIETLSRLEIDQLEARIIVGPTNQYVDELRQVVGSSSHDLQLITATSQMPELMEWADVAISAAGITCWELAFMGLPSMFVILAENQRGIAEKMSGTATALSIGAGEDLCPTTLAPLVGQFMADSKLRAEFSRRGRDLVDGKGCERVIAQLTRMTDEKMGNPVAGRSLRVRPATKEDMRLLWEWANDPTVRANSINQEPISWDSHVLWYNSRLTSPNTRFWILEAGGVPVGQIRYDQDPQGESAEITFSVAQGQRGHGYGRELIRLTLDLACVELAVRRITATTFVKNSASYRAFSRLGFKSSGVAVIGGHRCYQLYWRAEIADKGCENGS